MLEKYNVRTDLALEEKERFESDQVEIPGVILEEEYEDELEIQITKVKIETENGAKSMGKPVGVYLTIEAPNMAMSDEDYHREISEKLARKNWGDNTFAGERNLLRFSCRTRQSSGDAGCTWPVCCR